MAKEIHKRPLWGTIAEIPGAISEKSGDNKIVSNYGQFNGTRILIFMEEKVTGIVQLTRERRGSLQEKERLDTGEEIAIPDRTVLVGRIGNEGEFSTFFDPKEKDFIVVEDTRADPEKPIDENGFLLIGTTIVDRYGLYYGAIIKAKVQEPGQEPPTGEKILKILTKLKDAPIINYNESFEFDEEHDICIIKFGDEKNKNMTPIIGKDGKPNRIVTRMESDRLALQSYTEQPDGTWQFTRNIDYRKVLDGDENTIGTASGGVFHHPILPEGMVIRFDHFIRDSDDPNGKRSSLYGQAATLVNEETLEPEAWQKIGDCRQLKAVANKNPEVAAQPDENPTGKEVVYNTDYSYLINPDGTLNKKFVVARNTYADHYVVEQIYSLDAIAEALVKKRNDRLEKEKRRRKLEAGGKKFVSRRRSRKWS
jgi:hypothetical protein